MLKRKADSDIQSDFSGESETKRIRTEEAQPSRYKTLKDNCIRTITRLGSWFLEKISSPLAGQIIYWGMDLDSLPEVINKNFDKKTLINELFKDAILKDEAVKKTAQIQYLRKLLTLGADVNLKIMIPGGGKQHYLTPLAIALLHNDDTFLKLLDEFQVDFFSPIAGRFDSSRPPCDVESPFDLKSSLKQLLEDHTKLPLQFMTDKHNPEIRKRISRETKRRFPWFYEKGLHGVTAYYQILLQKILEQVKTANEANKKLLILIGEQHGDPHSLFIELLIMLIVNRHFQVKDLRLEIDDNRLKGLNGAWVALIEFVQKKLNGRVIPIDLKFSANDPFNNQMMMAGILGVPQDVPSAKESLQRRNQEMAKHLNNSQDPVVVAVVGSSHLFGLQTECDLSQFHIFSILALSHNMRIEKKVKKLLKNDYLQTCYDFEYNESEVFSAVNYAENDEEAKVLETFLPYSKLIKLANKVHEKSANETIPIIEPKSAMPHSA